MTAAATARHPDLPKAVHVILQKSPAELLAGKRTSIETAVGGATLAERMLTFRRGPGIKVKVDGAEKLAQGGLLHGGLLLADALESLREQLKEAVDRAQDQDLSFSCESVEVQLQVVVTTTHKGEAKAGLWSVVTLGGSVDHATSATHVVKLVLKPHLNNADAKLKLSDE